MNDATIGPQVIRDIFHAQRIEGWLPRESEGRIIDRFLHGTINADRALFEFTAMSHKESEGMEAKHKSWWRRNLLHTPYEDEHFHILRNRLGITSPRVLEKHTARASFVRTIEAFSATRTPTPPSDICEVHAKLFGDVFAWAGNKRIVNITKRGQHFAVVPRIDEHFDEAVKNLTEFDASPDAPLQQRIKLLAGFLTEFLWAHPFRDGNGRTATFFLMQRIPTGSLSRISPELWYETSGASLRGEILNPSPWFDVLAPLLKNN